MKKIYSEGECTDKIICALDEQKKKHFTLLNYIINKNSHPHPRCMDWEKLLLELEDFETYLMDIE